MRRDAGRGEDPVDPVAVRGQRLVAVEGREQRAALLRGHPGVLERAVGDERVVDGQAGLGGLVEVAGGDHGQRRVERGLALQHQLRGVRAGGRVEGLEVRVDEVELLVRAPVEEPDPRDHARAAAAPGLRADHVRRVRQPVVVVLLRVEPLGVVEDLHRLAARPAVAPEPDAVVVRRQVVADVAQLPVQALLRADDVRPLALQQLPHHGPALRPRVRRRVAGEAQVERHHVQVGLLGRRGRRRGEREHQRGERQGET